MHPALRSQSHPHASYQTRWLSRLIALCQHTLFIFSGLLALLWSALEPPNITLGLYSFFVVCWYVLPSNRARRVERSVRGLARFGLAYVACGCLLEYLAWASNALQGMPEPNALLHPNLLMDLLFAIVFYGCGALFWMVILCLRSLKLHWVVVTQGLVGIAIEQQGRVLLKSLEMLPFGMLIWIVLFWVYGAQVGLAYLLSSHIPTQVPREEMSLMHFENSSPRALGHDQDQE